jgi:cytochrome c biogenesis protein CcmG/thiol:disulfide interchange protein DsbE
LLYQDESARAGGAVVLALNFRQSSQALEAFNRTYGYTLPILMDPGGNTAFAYQVTSIPVTFFIDRAGVIRAVERGALAGMATLRKRVAEISAP